MMTRIKREQSKVSNANALRNASFSDSLAPVDVFCLLIKSEENKTKYSCRQSDVVTDKLSPRSSIKTEKTQKIVFIREKL
jgi:hypothetical protein